MSDVLGLMGQGAQQWARPSALEPSSMQRTWSVGRGGQPRPTAAAHTEPGTRAVSPAHHPLPSRSVRAFPVYARISANRTLRWVIGAMPLRSVSGSTG